MAFELIIRFEGFFAYFPTADHRATDVVFIRPSPMHPKHIPRVNLCHGNLKSGDKSFRPDGHDIELWDGSTHVFGSQCRGQHEFCGLPNLTCLFKDHDLHDGLKQPLLPLPKIASARFRIPDGDVRTSKWSEDVWHLIDEHGNIAPNSEGRVALEIEYTRTITSPRAKIVFRKGGKRTSMEFAPDGDSAIVQFLNLSSVNPRPGSGPVVSSHFRAVYGLVKDPTGLPRFNLVRKGLSGSGLHVPCVGGCTC